MAYHIPDLRRLRVQIAPAADLPYYHAYSTEPDPTTGSESTLADIIRSGTDISFQATLSGGMQVEILPRKLENPPEFLRVFGALYRRVDGVFQ